MKLRIDRILIVALVSALCGTSLLGVSASAYQYQSQQKLTAFQKCLYSKDAIECANPAR